MWSCENEFVLLSIVIHKVQECGKLSVYVCISRHIDHHEYFTQMTCKLYIKGRDKRIQEDNRWSIIHAYIHQLLKAHLWMERIRE